MRETSEGAELPWRRSGNRTYITEKHPDTLHFQCYRHGCKWFVEVPMTNEGHAQLRFEYAKHLEEKH